MTIKTLLIANRGEIAIRISRAAAALGIRTVAVYSQDDARSLHVRRADEARALKGSGPRAYLDIEQLVAVAKEAGCDAVHPGYGFLSENAAFATACAAAGITFVGPRPDLLQLFGDKGAARALAQKLSVPLLPGAFTAVTLNQAKDFFASLGAGKQLIIKAIAGGGGRGMRVVERLQDLEEAYARCQSEAKAAFGIGDVYVEQRLPHARHVEVQIVGDGTGAVTHLWERECTIQRRHQKLVEIAPSPGISAQTREKLTAAAVRMAKEVRYQSLGTFEFLVDAQGGSDPQIAFIEANARLQVEHTVTEEVLGVDLVQTQLRLAGGATLAQLKLQQSAIPEPRGMSVQLRVNMETMEPDGSTKPAGGTLSAFEPPTGPGIRVDAFGYSGYTSSPSFDSLLAKVIVTAPEKNLVDASNRAYRALCEFRIDGIATNIAFLQNLLRHPDFLADRIDTRFIEEHLPDLVTHDSAHPRLYVEAPGAASGSRAALAGARIDNKDPLAVLVHGKQAATPAASVSSGPTVAEDIPGMATLKAVLQGTIVSIDVKEGDVVRQGQQVLVMESMKMEHVIVAKTSGHLQRILVAVGDAVFEGAALALIEEADVGSATREADEVVDLDYIRPDLQEVIERHRRTLDEARPEAVAKRHAKNQRTARENVNQLCDPGTFIEYGSLAVAAQRARRSMEELIAKTPADGMITGVGRINGDLFGDPASRCAVMAYDYTVLAGTQGARNHIKTDRMIRVAEESQLPMVLFAEGGGGRPGDTEGSGDAGGTRTFARFAQLSALVPMVGITSGRCFAGNASLLGCCDVVIATANANLGMGGPAMIEGGGLGVFAPEEIGPMSVQVPNGVVDLLVKDESEAVVTAKKYLSYFQGRLTHWKAPDQRAMRRIIPENRLRVYDVRKVIETLSDEGGVLELRREFGKGMITSFIRVEGRAVGVVANNPSFLGGAIDSEGSDKAGRFMQLCDAFDIPVLFLCDTPGIMVGPEIEKTALVRHSSRLFLIGANLSVPFFTIVLRKAYGLGAIGMGGGSFKSPTFAVAWPTGEFGGMGLEGAVKLAYRNELAAIQDAAERKKKYDDMVASLYEYGKALSVSTIFGMDDTIDPADSRHWLATLLSSVRVPPRPHGKKRPFIDAW